MVLFVPVCNSLLHPFNVSSWYLMCLSIPGLQVWTWRPEIFFDCSSILCPLAPCRLQTWLLWWQTTSSSWICWLSPDLRGFVSAWSPCREFIPCLVGTEFVVSQSRHGCCTGTPQWVGGRTSHPVIRWWIGKGTSWAPSSHVPFVCLSGGAKP